MTTIALSTLLFTLLIVLLAATVLILRACLLPQRPVTISITGEEPLATVSGTRLLGQLQDAGYQIPSVCAGAGTCGLCKVTVTHGGGDILPAEKARLTASERQEGVRLACQVAVENDLTIALAGAATMASAMTCQVKSTRNLSTLIKEIVLELPNPDPQKPDIVNRNDFKFIPGQFVQVTSPAFQCSLADMVIDPACQAEWDSLNVAQLAVRSDQPVTRAYSIANTPLDNNTIVLLIRLALPPPDSLRSCPPGLVSSWLFSLNVGDSVSVTGPFGDFRVRDNDRDIVLIGGGVGMAPLRAMAHQALASETHRNIHFYYGARGQHDLFYQDEFNQLAAKHTNFNWTVALSDADNTDTGAARANNPEWTGPRGFVHLIVQREHIEKHPGIHQCDYYLCGPPLMLQATVAMLTRAGIHANQIFADDFGS